MAGIDLPAYTQHVAPMPPTLLAALLLDLA